MDREQWLRERQTGVGSSDAPNLVGVGYRTADDVYREKTEPVNPTVPESGYLARGIALEPEVAKRYEQVMGTQIIEPYVDLPDSPEEFVKAVYDASQGGPFHLIRHPQRPWQFASTDRKRKDNGASIELKTTAGFGDSWGENGSADIPEGYRVQVQHQMGVTGTRQCDLAALNVIDWELRVFRIDFDPEFWEWLTMVEHSFWVNHVVAKRPPGPRWEQEVRPQAALRLPTPGLKIDLGAEAAMLLDRRAELKRIEKQAADEAKGIDAKIDGLLGDAEAAVAGGWRIKKIFVKGGEVKYTRDPYVRLNIRQ